MAATDPTRSRARGSVLAAALALPGLVGGLTAGLAAAPQAARAENAPEQGTLAFKYLHYRDAQPGLERISVDAPSVYLLAPLTPQWSIEASAVNDAVSGASPRYYSVVSSASHMRDNRSAVDAKLTHYRERSVWGVSLSRSKEHDYLSNAIGLDGRLSSEDHNTSLNFGLGWSGDDIDSTNRVARDQHKHTLEMLVGMTRSLTPVDIVQVNLTHSRGHGYYTDPYKQFDNRPDNRRQTALLTRWNHHFESLDATLRSSFRYYGDNWGVRSATLGAEWVQPLSSRFTLTPELRYYTQTAAKFYTDPTEIGGLVLPPLLPAGSLQTADQRLAAFGGVTVGLKADWRFAADWSADLKGEYIEQRSRWRLGGSGSPGIDTFRASSMQLGLARRF